MRRAVPLIVALAALALPGPASAACRPSAVGRASLPGHPRPRHLRQPGAELDCSGKTTGNDPSLTTDTRNASIAPHLELRGG
jgi:hypothetical protein